MFFELVILKSKDFFFSFTESIWGQNDETLKKWGGKKAQWREMSCFAKTTASKIQRNPF